MHTALEPHLYSPWLGEKVDSGIGFSYRPASPCSLAGRYGNTMPESSLSLQLMDSYCSHCLYIFPLLSPLPSYLTYLPSIALFYFFTILCFSLPILVSSSPFLISPSPLAVFSVSLFFSLTTRKSVNRYLFCIYCTIGGFNFILFLEFQ